MFFTFLNQFLVPRAILKIVKTPMRCAGCLIAIINQYLQYYKNVFSKVYWDNKMDTVVHEKLPKPLDPLITDSVNTGFKCESCLLVFMKDEDLKFHCSTERKKFPCGMCSILFSTLKGMRQHYGKKHAKSRPYRCALCSKRFRNIYAARIHKQQVHFHKSRQNCELCGKRVFNKYSLIRHLRICPKNI